jgi:hypothetical protein
MQYIDISLVYTLNLIKVSLIQYIDKSFAYALN